MNDNDMTKTQGRHNNWLLTAAFSTVALVAMVQTYDDKLKDQDRATKWVVSAISIALSFSALGAFSSVILKERFVSTMIEGCLAFVTCGFWAAVLPAVMDPNNALAIFESTGGIKNANLYFFSWGGLVMSFFTLYGFTKEKYGGKSFSPSTWGALCITSFITMVSASRLWQDLACEKDMPESILEDVCTRTAAALSAGVISALVAAIWPLCAMFLSGILATVLEAVISVVMLILWVFGVVYITFGGDKAPASVIGNLYFFTWFSFGISVFLAMNGINLAVNRKKVTECNDGQATEDLEEKMETDEPGNDMQDDAADAVEA